MSDRTRTLILEIALPDFHCDDYRVDGSDEVMNEVLREWCESDNPTPEQLADAALEDSGLTTPRVNLSILLGSKDGNFLERVKGQIVGARIVERAPDHELSDDDRLDCYEGEWIARVSHSEETPDTPKQDEVGYCLAVADWNPAVRPFLCSLPSGHEGEHRAASPVPQKEPGQ